MSGLPSAEHQSPACGACQGETEYTGDKFACYDCGLSFDLDTLEASFIDPDAQVCGAQCDNYWHGDNKIRPGEGYVCGTCRLPSGHTCCLHWTGCELVSLEPEL